MLTPEYLAATPDALVELYGKIEQDILANMAERIAKYDYYIPAVQHQHQRLRAMGMLETEIEQQLAALTGKTQAELKKLMAQAVDEALTSDAKIYAAAGMGDVDPLAVAGVREALQSGLRQTSGIFRNLTRTTANTAAKQFEDALDRACCRSRQGRLTIIPRSGTRSRTSHGLAFSRLLILQAMWTRSRRPFAARSSPASIRPPQSRSSRSWTSSILILWK